MRRIHKTLVKLRVCEMKTINNNHVGAKGLGMLKAFPNHIFNQLNSSNMKNQFLNQFADVHRISIKQAKLSIASKFIQKTKMVYNSLGIEFTVDDEIEYRKLLSIGKFQSVFDYGTWDECGFYLCI